MTAISQLQISTQTLPAEFEPSIVKDGVLGARFYKDGEPLFLRMELLTPNNCKHWGLFQRLVSGSSDSGLHEVFSNLVYWAGTDECPRYEEMAKVTGFTKEEYSQFNIKAIQAKINSANKIKLLLDKNKSGYMHMCTSFCPDQVRYIVYISRNPNFSIQNCYSEDQEVSLKNVFNKYNDIIISMGSNFTENSEATFENRGISKNPYWVFEEKYTGSLKYANLSMILHGFTGAVAEKYFRAKILMEVTPLGSMLRIIKENLNPGEGVQGYGSEKTDITNLKYIPVSESATCYIKISALTRIYQTSMQALSKLDDTHRSSRFYQTSMHSFL